jgi:site-specific recombinase XerD
MKRMVTDTGTTPARPHGSRAACAYADEPPLAPLLNDSACSWSVFWDRVQGELRRRGYRRGSRRVYRQVLRGLARTCRVPAEANRDRIACHLYRLADRRRSASWLATNLCILRTVFDKLGGRDLLSDRSSPRRPHRLPVVLNRNDVSSVLRAAWSIRDAMLLGLIYGCGLKVGEARSLRWSDVDPAAGTLRVTRSDHGTCRELRLPEGLRGYFKAGAGQFAPEAWVFPGRSIAQPLSVRMCERIVRCCAWRAGIAGPVSPMTLRHSYAVHALEDGCHVRELQVALGHRSLETTMRYLACLRPVEVESPLDGLYRSASMETMAEVEQELCEPRRHLARVPVLLRRTISGIPWFRRHRSPDPPG